MAKEKYWSVENGIVKPIKLPGINHGDGDDKDSSRKTKTKISKTKKK